LRKRIDIQYLRSKLTGQSFIPAREDNCNYLNFFRIRPSLTTLKEGLTTINIHDELRKWYNYDHLKWEHFKQMYKNELAGKQRELERLKQLEIKHGTLTLLYSSKEEEYNKATALKEFLLQPDG